MVILRFILFPLLFLSNVCSAAVDNYYPYALRISSENGLSQNNVLTMAKDEQNRVWVGTRDGLNLLNNNEFILFKNGQSKHRLSGIEITDLAMADNHRLWVASNAGLDSINTLSLQSRSIPMPKGHQAVSHLVVSADQLFFLSEQQLYRFDTAKGRPMVINLPIGPLISVDYFDEHTLLLTGPQGFSTFEWQTGKLQPISVSLPKGQLKAVLRVADTLWVSLMAKGVFACDLQQLQCVHYSKESGDLASDNIAKIVAEDDLLYFATDNGIGVFQRSTKQWQWIYPHAKNQAYKATQIARDVLVTDSGDIFAGTYNGLYRIPAEYKTIQAISVETEGFPNAALDIATVVVNGQQRLAIAEPDQISLWDMGAGQLIPYQQVKYPAGFEPSHMMADSSHLYFSSLTNGSLQYTPATGQFVSVESLFPGVGQQQLNNIDSPEDNIRVLHFEHEMKVYKLQQGRWRLLWQKAFARGSATARYWQGHLFVAAYQNGLMSAKMDDDWHAPTKWVHHQGLGIVINLQAQSQKLYVLSASKGLFQVLGGKSLTITRLPVSDQLTSETLVCALNDDQGRLLLSGHKGLAILDANQHLQANLTVLQGLHAQEFSQFSCGRIHGMTYFAGKDGLTLLKDTSITHQQPSAPHWTMLEADGEQIPWGSSPKPLRSPSLVTLHFVSSESELPQQAAFRYRILPLSNQWTELKSSFISLINLRPGDYEIELQVLNSAGMATPIASTKLQILPAMWESPLAIGLYVAMGLLIIVALVTNQIRATRAKLALQIEQNKRQSDYARQLEAEVKSRTRELEEKKEEAMEANLAKTRFVAAASHDLKQSLNVMRLQIEQLEENELRSRLGRSLHFLEQLVASIVELSRLDAKVVKPNFSTFSMPRFMEQLAADYGELAQHKGVMLRNQNMTESWVYSDPVLLKRILGNLIDNAIKISKIGDHVDVKSFDQGNHLVIEIKDYGPGMSEQVQQGLYIPFRRWTSSYLGSGLGLSVVKGFADLLNLSIDLQSKLDQGSCFRLTVPIQHSIEAGPQLLDALKVALIEDDPEQRQTMEELLIAKGLSVNSYCTAENFLQTDEPMDLILSDINLGESQHGTDFVDSYMQKIHSGGIVVYISANPETRYLVPKRERVFFLAKPIKWGKLAWLLQQVNNRS